MTLDSLLFLPMSGNVKISECVNVCVCISVNVCMRGCGCAHV